MMTSATGNASPSLPIFTSSLSKRLQPSDSISCPHPKRTCFPSIPLEKIRSDEAIKKFLGHYVAYRTGLANLEPPQGLFRGCRFAYIHPDISGQTFRMSLLDIDGLIVGSWRIPFLLAQQSLLLTRVSDLPPSLVPEVIQRLVTKALNIETAT